MQRNPARHGMSCLSMPAVRLVLASFLMLFTELVLIRWTGSNVIYLSYFSNLILLGSFLGIGIGFMRTGTARGVFYLAPFLLTAFVAFIHQFPFEIDRSGSNLVYFGWTDSAFPLPPWLFLPIIFMAVAAVMASIADGVADSFREFKPLQAYRLDILGSLAGIIAFSVCGALHATPIAWGMIISLCFSLLFLHDWLAKKPLSLLQIFSLVMLLVLFSKESNSPHRIWSPYYKIGILHQNSHDTYHITTNGIPHQEIMSRLEREKNLPMYFVPYQSAGQNTPLNDVLIIGAGTGGDVAIALEKGAGRIDAIEIDPVLYQLGRTLNPDRPYDDPRVHVTIDDGRAFLQRSSRQYDMILFALPDSLTLLSGQSSLRLENYLFTLEAMETMKKHLKPHGLFSMYNFYREPWLVDRFVNTLQTVFGQTPCVTTWGSNGHWLSVLSIREGSEPLRCQTAWHNDPAWKALPSTDDHPFIYLKKNSIPSSYLWMLLFVLAASVVSIQMMGGSCHSVTRHLDFFFMGAAFLLLETKSIVCFALLFGTTWHVNALVFAGVLLSVYLSIEVAARTQPGRKAWHYAGLGLSLFLAASIKDSSLLALAAPVRFLLAAALAFGPVFFGNLIFAERFRHLPDPLQAFGANLAGAMMGGIGEYVSLVIGYHDLLFLAGGLYLFALLASLKPPKVITAG